MIRICYIMLAHSNLNNVAQIIKLLSGDGVGFIVHIDKKCVENTHPLCSIPEVELSNDRYDVKWGDVSMVDAVVSLIRQALSDKRRFDYFIFLSGQCVPVKPAAYIQEYLKSHCMANFISASPIPSVECGWLEGGRRRLECYAVRLSERDIATIEPRRLDFGNFRQLCKTATRGNISALLHALNIFLFAPKRKPLNNLRPFGGEFWWRMNRASLETVLSYYDANPEIRQQMKVTSNPDEIIFNTLAFNLCGNTANNLLTFVNWGGVKVHLNFYSCPTTRPSLTAA